MREFLHGVFNAALAAALPSHCLPQHLPRPEQLPDPKRGRIVVIGAGKASSAMALALEQHAKAHWPEHWPTLSGLVLTRYGQALPCQKIEIVEAAHPVPDEAGFNAARRMLHEVTQNLTQDDLVIALISGGGSALLTQPAEGINLAEKQAINKTLLSCGATIAEMNTVRKHLSAIKGGHLALACAPAKVLSLLISDVPGDDPSIIASGPTVPDLSTCADTLRIIDKYQIQVSASVRERLRDGTLESVKVDHPALAHHEMRMITTPQMALEAAAQFAEAQGIRAHILADDLEGEAKDAGLFHGALVRHIHRHGTPFARPCLLLSGGETTVSLPAEGKAQDLGAGGRNVEFLLHLLHDLREILPAMPAFCAMAADTDGVDGARDVAGAFIDAQSLVRADTQNVSLATAIARHDGHGFFGALGDALITGPTHTNVNDFRAIYIP